MFSNKSIIAIFALILNAVFRLSASPALAQCTDPIKDALLALGVIASDSKKHLAYFSRTLATFCLCAALIFVPAANAALFSTDWVQSSPIPNSTATGTLGAINVTLSTGAYANAGGVFPGTWDQILPTSLGILSPDEGIAIAFPCGSSAPQAHSVTFSTSVANPYLLFNYVDAGTVYNFSANSGTVSLEGNTVSASLSSGIVTLPSSPVLNQSNHGFVVRLTGTYSTINFEPIRKTNFFKTSTYC